MACQESQGKLWSLVGFKEARADEFHPPVAQFTFPDPWADLNRRTPMWYPVSLKLITPD